MLSIRWIHASQQDSQTLQTDTSGWRRESGSSITLKNVTKLSQQQDVPVQCVHPFIRVSHITLSSNFLGAHSSMLFIVAVTSVGRYTCSGSFMVSRYLIGGKFIMSKTRKSRREGGECKRTAFPWEGQRSKHKQYCSREVNIDGDNTVQLSCEFARNKVRLRI